MIARKGIREIRSAHLSGALQRPEKGLWIMDSFALRFQLEAERAIWPAFPTCRDLRATGKALRSLIKDRVRYSAFTAETCREALFPFARGRALCNFSKLSEPFRPCQPYRHLFLTCLP